MPAGIETSYLEAGSGPPVIMLHGSGPGVSGKANWQYNIPALAERFHVLAPDIVGFGRHRASRRHRLFAARLDRPHMDVPRRTRHREDGDRRQLPRWAHRAADGHRPTGTDLPDGADGLAGGGHEPHRRTASAAGIRAVARRDARPAAQLLRGGPVAHHRRAGRDPVRGQHRRRRLRGVPRDVLRSSPQGIRTRHHRGRRYARSRLPRCSSTAARTRWCRCRCRSRCSACCPMPTCTCSATAGTGPRSSAPTSSPRWSPTTWPDHDHRYRIPGNRSGAADADRRRRPCGPTISGAPLGDDLAAHPSGRDRADLRQVLAVRRPRIGDRRAR